MNQLAEALAGELPGPPVRALYVYNCNPAAVAPDQQQGARGPAARRPVHRRPRAVRRPTPSTTPTSSCPPRRSSSTSTSTARTATTYVMLNPPAIAPRGECRSNNDVFRALAARLGFEPELFPDDETLIREAPRRRPDARGHHARTARGRGLGPAQPPRALTPRSPTGVFPTPSGKCELYSERMKADGLDPLPTYIPPREDPQTRPDLAARYPAPAAQPAAAAVPQLDLRQPAAPPRRRPATRPIELAAEDAARARPGRRPVGRGLQRPRPVPGPGRADRRRPARRGRRDRASTGTSSAPGRRNVNSTTSSALTDMGGGATFFDNLVEVRPAADAARTVRSRTDA